MRRLGAMLIGTYVDRVGTPRSDDEDQSFSLVPQDDPLGNGDEDGASSTGLRHSVLHAEIHHSSDHMPAITGYLTSALSALLLAVIPPLSHADQ
jgi:hypothetical protein